MLAIGVLGAQAQEPNKEDTLLMALQGNVPTEEEPYDDENEVEEVEDIKTVAEEVVAVAEEIKSATEEVAAVATNTTKNDSTTTTVIADKAHEELLMAVDSALLHWAEKHALWAKESVVESLPEPDSTVMAASDTPDEVYIQRLRDIGSAIPLGYNSTVRSFIVSYTTRNRQVVSNALGRAQYYFPLFEAELDAQQMPQELKVLAVIESALIPKARSKKGAAGLWQFMYSTSRGYGLEVSSFIDQRFDPMLSTRAACKFLKHLYNTYDDWMLALAAYNCGPGNVNKALRRSDGGKTFWEIYPYLPRETRSYVPAFIAMTYAMHYHKLHGIEPAEPPVPIATDSLKISRIMHLEQISSTIGTPIEVLRALNPQYKQDIIPAVRGRSYSLVLPLTEVGKYLDNEATIVGKDTIYMKEYLSPEKVGNIPQFVIDSKTHVVKKGENLSLIARKYGVTVKQICKWNNIKDASKIRIGQRLEIFLK